ncbi:pyridoxal-phosphate dependent enzyme [Streptomyces sp. NPDC054854]
MTHALPGYLCPEDGTRADVRTAPWCCPVCGGPWDIDFAPDPAIALEPAAGPHSLWRYAAALPLPGAFSVSLPEGHTPLVPLAERIHAKLDSLMPTLSFKDRGAVMLAEPARRLAPERVVADSSGNAGTSVTAYCARAGLSCEVFVPEGTSEKKTEQMRARGATVRIVPGGREATARAARAAADAPGVDTDHALRAGRLQRDRPHDGALPGRGEVPAPAPHVEVDTVGDGPVRFHAVGPLLAPVRERDLRGEDVSAVLGVRQVRERGGQLDADLAIRGDSDRLVAVPLAGLSVGGEEPALRLPTFPPCGLGQLGGGQVVSGVEQAPAAAYDVHDSGLALGASDIETVLQRRQAPGLVEPLALRAVAARSALGALLPEGEGQPVRQRPHTGLKPLDVGELAAGERPLIVRGLRDRPGPTRRRAGGQTLLAGRPRVRGVFEPVTAASGQITGGQGAEVLADQAQQLLVLGREVLEAVA